jgi:ABC-type transport system involved in multi-copper enzyme maturation permease subunit
MNRLIRSELLKIRTTNTWWIFTLASAIGTALALAVNFLKAHLFLHSTAGMTEGASSDQVQALQAQSQVVTQAANVFTSGQFLGCLFAALIGILLITNEYYHQTATATFLTTPRRTKVVAAKLITAVAYSAVFWLVATAIAIPAGLIFFKTEGFPSHLGDWDIIGAILLNLLAFAIWAIFGIGFGALIRSQIGATVTVAVLYVVGLYAADLIFALLHVWLQQDWVQTAQIIVPSTASQVMLSPVKLFAGSPPQWVGALVLIGYGAIAGLIGTFILRKRDVS